MYTHIIADPCSLQPVSEIFLFKRKQMWVQQLTLPCVAFNLETIRHNYTHAAAKQARANSQEIEGQKQSSKQKEYRIPFRKEFKHLRRLAID